jgi:hypothetical protein
VVFGWRALRPPRVVFVIGCVSCNKFSHFRQKQNNNTHKSQLKRTKTVFVMGFAPPPNTRAAYRLAI